MVDRAEFLAGPLVALWALPAAVVLLTLLTTRRSDTQARRQALFVIRLIVFGYLIAVAIITLWPLNFDPSVASVERGNWTPFQGTLGFVISDNELKRDVGSRDAIANVLLFAPLGLLMPYAFYQWRGVFVAVLALVFLAFGLEIAQGVLVAERTFDIDDAITGFAGGTAAVGLSALLRPIFGHA